MPLKRFFKIIFLFLIVYAIYLVNHTEYDLPPLQNGDLVFQTTWTNQTLATILASNSIYTHTGIVKETGDGPVVIEAGNVVRETKLHDWIAGGVVMRFAVYRYDGLTPEQGKAIVNAAKKYYGKPYDYYFYEGDGGIYCSELDYLVFKDAGVPVGQIQKIRDLNINNRFVKQLIEDRWQGYPQCKGKDITFDQCYDIILDGALVTPASIAEDSHLKRIFSNYP